MDTIKTFLFDLDGTLLPMDTEKFTKDYFKALSTKLAPCIDPTILPKLVWASTEAMIKNVDKDKYNQEVFFEDFRNRIDVDLDDLYPVFEDFYNNEFKLLKQEVEPHPDVRETIALLKSKGYQLVVATNPLFPKEAIYHRIEWAGLNKEDFDFVTTYEIMHFCKPNLEYYEEILIRLNRQPHEVIMIGNDVQEDMVAGQLGIKTYLIDDFAIDRKTNNFEPDYQGSYKDFFDHVKKLGTANY